MQKLISKYGLAAHLALLAVAPLVVFPFLAIDEISKVILWLSLLVFGWFLNAPSRINKERSTSEARRRISKALLADPIFWIFAIVTLLAGFRALNNGISLAYDAESYIWYMTEPAVSVFPACCEGAGFPVFVSTLLSFIAYTIAKHALGKGARLALVYFLGLFAGIAGLVALYEYVMGNEGVIELARCGVENPSYIGIGFGIMALMLTSAIPLAFEKRWNVALATFPIALGGVFAAMITFSPAYMSSAFLAVGILILAYGLFWSLKKLGKTTSLRIVVVFGASLFVALVVIYGTSFKLVGERFSSLSAGFIPALEADISAKLSAVSMKVWKVKLWLGSGLGTFPQQFRFNATDADWAVVSVQQLMPLNGWSYLLIERGIIGALLMLVPAAGLAWGYVSRVITAVKEIPSPMVFAGPLAAIIAFSLNIFNTSLFRIESLPLIVLAVALSTNSWAKEKIDGQ